jgi:hypothetical protein
MPGSSRVPRAAMVGDPFFPAIIAAYGAVSKGIKVVKGIQRARALARSGGGPPPSSAMVGQRSPVFGGSSLPIEENTAYIQKVLRGGRKPPTGLVPPGSRIQTFPAGVAATRRRYRRMHVTNVKALRRAMRRVQGFAKIAKNTITFTHAHHLKHRRKR